MDTSHWFVILLAACTGACTSTRVGADQNKDASSPVNDSGTESGGSGSGMAGSSGAGDSSSGGAGHSGVGGSAGSSSGGITGSSGVGGEAGASGHLGIGGVSGASGSIGGAGEEGDASFAGTGGFSGSSGVGGHAGTGRAGSSGMIDAGLDAPAVDASDSSDVLDTECDVSGIKVSWTATSLPPGVDVTGVNASFGGLPPSQNVCGPADDLNSDPATFACCLATATGSFSGTLYLDFVRSDGLEACNTTGCPLVEFTVTNDGSTLAHNTDHFVVTLEDPGCMVMSGTCQWVAQIDP